MLICEDIKIKRGACTLTGHVTLNRGERVALFAPSGSGKSTFLEALAGFVPFEEGRLLWHQEDLTSLEAGTRPISYLFQEGNLFEHLTIFQNVVLGVSKELNRIERQRRVDQMLARFEIANLSKRPAATVSGGQKQRAALARCLLQEKPILLLDEPFNGIDDTTKEILYDVLQEQTTSIIVLTTHNPVDIERLATRTLTLKDGMIMPSDSSF
jgi:thiamine transport system ATP-binding protein